MPYYATAVVLFIVLKFAFTRANNNDLSFLLQPTDKFVGFLTGSHSIYFSESGYFHEQLNIIIDKSCSGFNFMILCFLLFTYVIVSHSYKTFSKIVSIPAALLGAYVLTILVNTSRIFASIVVQAQTKSIFITQQHMIHEAIGVITNVSFLIIAYILLEKFLKKKKHYEKFA